MTRAIPEHWIERLFARMESTWGAKFQDFWRNVDALDEVKRTWRLGLADMNDVSLKRGVGALIYEKGPPDLPRFRELCRPTPQQFVVHRAVSDQRTRISPEGEAQLQRIKDLLMANPAYLSNSPRADGIQWAYRLLDRAQRGDGVNAMQIAFAEDAIRRWKASHPVADIVNDIETDIDLPARIPSPHIYRDEAVYEREPGSDDEVAA